MAVLVLILGAVMTSLPAAARRIGHRLKPAEWSRISTAALVGGTLIAQVGLLMLAAPTILRSLGVHAVADACDRAIAPLSPFGDVGGWLALGLLGLSLAGGADGLVRARRQASAAWIDVSIGERWRTTTGVEVVLVPTPTPLA